MLPGFQVTSVAQSNWSLWIKKLVTSPGSFRPLRWKSSQEKEIRKEGDRIFEAAAVTPTFWSTDKQPLQRVVGSYLDCAIRSLSQQSWRNPEGGGTSCLLTFTPEGRCWRGRRAYHLLPSPKFFFMRLRMQINKISVSFRSVTSRLISHSKSSAES